MLGRINKPNYAIKKSLLCFNVLKKVKKKLLEIIKK